MKCNCENAQAYCSTHSKVKMSVQVKDEYKTSFNNHVFYSYFKEDKKPEATIVINMLRRLERNFKNTYNCILFFNNQTDTLIHTHK